MRIETAAEAKVMRAIVDREHRTAMAERRAAREAHAGANAASVRPRVGWSTKAPPRRKPSDIDRAIAARAEEHRLDWARRHPDAAKAERAFRKGRAEMADRWDHKREGTIETHERASRTHQGALARLWHSGAIDADQLAAAVEIAIVAERIGADVAVRTASLETRIDSGRRGDGAFYEALSRVRHEVAYTRWRAAIDGPIGAVLDMVVGETVGFTVVAKRYRMHNRRAKKLLIDALDLWPRVLGQVCKEIDRAAVDQAHATIT
ncbi:hypothetical protein [Sphingomonas sp. Leaf62]|uniref:hypothetical protein n=1 Tax=Sphingomonas sp. Leaf62 TaxID=1736228 RepID=UPI001F463A10|nr:hypothetical protein [Sphingomonas sp. Leaf62]